MLLSVAATNAQNYGEVITEQPAGTEYTLYAAATGYTEFLQRLIPYDVDGAASKLVIAEDGSVYLYNPVVGFITKSWLKGSIDKETNIVTFKLPQTIFADVINDDEGFPYTEYNIACKMKYNYELSTFLATPEDQELKFSWDGKKLTMLDDQFLGVASTDGTWYGIGDETKNYEVLEDKVAAPEKAGEDLSFMMKYTTKEDEEKALPVTVQVEGNNIFVKGLTENVPEGWIKGEIDGNKVTFSNKQYLGYDEENNRYDYFVALDKNNEMMNSVTMTYDPMDMTMTSTDLLTVNYGKNRVNTIDYFNAPTFYQWEETAAAPAAPVIKNCTPEDGDYSWFTVTLPTKSEDGIDLKIDNIYYNIYYDDELFTFTTSPYSTFDKDMSDIPFEYSDYGYFITKEGNDRIIYTYKKGFKKIGVQCFYLDGENKLKSKMAVWGETDGIDSVAAGEGTTTTWTDLSGREVKSPSKGIFIKTQKTADGTVKVSKQLFK